MICPCGCTELVPRQTSSIWRNSEPYWEWICVKQGCKQLHVPWRNQSGDPNCSWCGHRRVFIGHFQANSDKGHWRYTVLGERMPRPTNKQDALAALLFAGFGYPGGVAKSGEVPIPRENRT